MFFEAGTFFYIYLAIFGLLTVGVVVFLIIKYKNKEYEQKLKPIQWLFFLLVFLEVVKIFWLITRGGGLAPLRFPIVFCSIILYAWPMFAFRKNRFSEGAKALAVIPAMLAGISFLIRPGDISPEQIGDGFFTYAIAAHSFFFHCLMIGVAVYMLAVGIYKIRKDNYFSAFLTLTFYLIAATVISLFIGNDISIFGPQSGFLGFLYDLAGYVPGQLLLISVTFILFFTVHKSIGKNKDAEV